MFWSGFGFFINFLLSSHVFDFRIIFPGAVRCQMKEQVSCRTELTVESVDGQAIPSYATANMINNALKRSWIKGNVEILFCCESQREWVRNLSSNVRK